MTVEKHTVEFDTKGDAKVVAAMQRAKKAADNLLSRQHLDAWKEQERRIAETTEGLKSYHAELARTRDKLAKMSQSGSSGFGQLASTAKLAGVGVAAFAGAAVVAHKAATALAEESLKTQNVFNNLPFSLNAARQATHGLIDDMTLATAANQMMSLGVVKNQDEFAKMAAAAQALGQKLGIGTERAIDSLNAAIGRGSSLMLDNLGIILNQTQAQEQYAAKIGKTKDELTEAEKAEAFKKVALEKVFEATESVKIVTDGAAAATARFNAELANLKAKALGAEEPTTSLHDALGALSNEQRDTIDTGDKHGRTLQALRVELMEAGASSDVLSMSASELKAALNIVRNEEYELAMAILQTKEPSAEQIAQLRRIALDAQNAARQMHLLGKANELTFGQMQANAKARGAREEKLVERQDLKTTLATTEEMRVAAQARGKSQREISDLVQAELRLKSQIATIESGLVEDEKDKIKLANEAADLERQAQLEEIRVQNTRKSNTKALRDARKSAHDEFIAQVMRERAEFERWNQMLTRSQQQAQLDAMGARQSQTIGDAASLFGQGRRDESRARADMAANDARRSLEMQAQNNPEMLQQLEDQKFAIMMTARQRELEDLKRNGAAEADVLRKKDEIRELMHQHEISRMQREAAERQANLQKMVQGTQIASQVQQQAFGLGGELISANIKDAKKQADAQNKMLGAQAFGIGTLEAIKAAAAFASLNPIQGGMHTAASAFAFARGALLMSGAIGQQASVPSGGGGGGRGGGGGSFDDRDRADLDGPLSRADAHSGPKASKGTTQGVTINFNSMLPADKKKAGLMIQQAIKESQNSVGSAT